MFDSNRSTVAYRDSWMARPTVLLILLLSISCGWLVVTAETASSAASPSAPESSEFLLFPAATSEQYTFSSLVWRSIDPKNFSFCYQDHHAGVAGNETLSDYYPKPIVQLLEAAKDRFLQSLQLEQEFLEKEDGDDAGALDSFSSLFSSTKRHLSKRSRTFDNNNTSLVPLTCLWIDIVDPTITDAEHGVDESYQLQISALPVLRHPDEHDATKTDRLSATTVFGILHGLTSLRQLLVLSPEGRSFASHPSSEHDEEEEEEEHGRPHHPHPHPKHHHHDLFILPYTPLVITDAPRFPHRGLLIDTSRHYLSVSFLLDVITSMAWNKLNVLHWHITDSQSWPLVLKETLPEVSQQGAYCDTCVYTQHDIAHLRKHAWYHGIRIIPEVDVPGHIQSLGKSHPEWLSPCGYDTDERVNHGGGGVRGEERRSEPLDPTNEQVFEVFLPKLYEELATRLFPNTSMIHIGGDEVSLTCWNTSPTIQAWMKQQNITQSLELWKLFERRLLQDILPKVPSFTIAIVWQEVFNEGLISDYNNHSNNDKNSSQYPRIVVNVWKGLDVPTIQQALQQDFAVLVSGCWYLDHLDQDWANMYKCNILSALPTNDTSSSSLLWGGHSSMWGERADETDFMSRVWPRASAVAERLWSGYYNSTSTTENNNNNSHLNFETSVEDRLDAFRCFLLSQGIPASPIRPGYCSRGHRFGSAVKGRTEYKSKAL